MKHYPSNFMISPYDIKQPIEINIDSLQRPAGNKDIVNGEKKLQKCLKHMIKFQLE